MNMSNINPLRNFRTILICDLIFQQFYDKKEETSRKCLLPRTWNAQTNEDDFNIWLCSNCDAQLYSKEAYYVSFSSINFSLEPSLILKIFTGTRKVLCHNTDNK